MSNLELDKTVFSVGHITENDEKEYWLSRTPEERLIAIETNRKILYGYLETPPRLQRILEVVNLKDR